MKNIPRIFLIAVAAMALLVWTTDRAYSTASTHIWAPSTDTQDFKTGHVTADVYVPV
jgi:hypothetical protein